MWRDLLNQPLTPQEQQTFQWQEKPLQQAKLYTNSTHSLLIIDDIVSMQVLTNDQLGSTKTLINCCGEPDHQTNTNQGTLWSYNNWAAWVRNDKIQELWINDSR